MRYKNIHNSYPKHRPVINIVLDGWGIGTGTSEDAIAQAATPTIDKIKKKCGGGTSIYTHGKYVGLPSMKDLGGSEVGHMTMGAGRVVAQGATRIKEMIDNGELQNNSTVQTCIKHCQEHNSPLHLIGLLSDGNIHSHIEHTWELIKIAFKNELPRVYIHALLDGRDVGYQSADQYVEWLESRIKKLIDGRDGFDYAIASGGGREVITMDRDQNWSKIELGWMVHVEGSQGEFIDSVTSYIHEARQKNQGIADQDIAPFVVIRDGQPIGRIEDGAVVIFTNFRSDRAIEFSQAMTGTVPFKRQRIPKVLYAGMSVYDEDTNLPNHIITTPPRVDNGFGDWLLENKLKQFRLAETQKYAHVTFFFNGGRREVRDADLEAYNLIASDKVASFAMRPQMKALEIAAQAKMLIESKSYAYGLINFANADMVGHSGDLAASIQAVQYVDRALAIICSAIDKVGGIMLITADHGNVEEMRVYNPKRKAWEPSTKHSLNPVPFYIYDSLNSELPQLHAENTLANLYATNQILLGYMPSSYVDRALFI